MAYSSDMHCVTCKKVTNHVNGTCSQCTIQKHQERIAKWNKMSVDERLNDLRERLEKFEGKKSWSNTIY